MDNFSREMETLKVKQKCYKLKTVKILKIKNATECSSLDSVQPGKKSGNFKIDEKKVPKMKHRASKNCGTILKNLTKM